MAARDPLFYLVHIRECCERILSYTKNLGTAWPGSPMVVDAVCRNLEIIGEAASKLDPEFRQAHGEIPWRNIIGTRNLLIHAYDQVDPAILGGIVERDIPELAQSGRANAANEGHRTSPMLT
jgi:uncharacterized protein with HEPN domain